jgi:hypothetical protein
MLTAAAKETFIRNFAPVLNVRGSGATLTATLASTGSVRSATVDTIGAGYNVDDVLTISNATFTVTSVDGDGGVTGVTVTTAGSGFSADGNAVATTVAPSGGTGCKLDYLIEKAIASVTVGAGGTGYVTPFVVVTGAVGDTAATLTPVVSNGVIASVTVTAGGKYRSAPTLTVDPRGANSNASFLNLLISTDEDNDLQYPRLLSIIHEIEATEGFPDWASGYVTAAKATLSA